MSVDRRGFLKLAGLASVAGVGAGKVVSAVAEDGRGSMSVPPAALDGQRWAMVIDTRICREHEDCHDCAHACHRAHNVPQFDDPKDEVKWIWKEHFANAFPEKENEHVPPELVEHEVLVMCNHCDNPPCVRVCPTQTTWQREDGVVMMDMHRCIGCRYCVAACPYGSRSFNWRDPRPHIPEITSDFPTRTRGVVEKCNFCAERLAKGLGPACVEACPHDAMAFGDLEDANSKVREWLHDAYSIRRKPSLGTHPQVYYLV